MDAKLPRVPPPWVIGPFLKARHVLGRTYRSLVPTTARVLEGSFGLIETKALGAAAELGVADALANCPPATEALASLVGANADALGRLLRLLTSIGYFTDVDGRGTGPW